MDRKKSQHSTISPCADLESQLDNATVGLSFSGRQTSLTGSEIAEYPSDDDDSEPMPGIVRVRGPAAINRDVSTDFTIQIGDGGEDQSNADRNNEFPENAVDMGDARNSTREVNNDDDKSSSLLMIPEAIIAPDVDSMVKDAVRVALQQRDEAEEEQRQPSDVVEAVPVKEASCSQR